MLVVPSLLQSALDIQTWARSRALALGESSLLAPDAFAAGKYRVVHRGGAPAAVDGLCKPCYSESTPVSPSPTEAKASASVVAHPVGAGRGEGTFLPVVHVVSSVGSRARLVRLLTGGDIMDPGLSERDRDVYVARAQDRWEELLREGLC